MMNKIKTSDIAVGVVGLGLMGSSIVVSLLIAGHPVKAIAPLPEDMKAAPERINNHLAHCERSGLLNRPIDSYLQQLIITEDYTQLHKCKVVLECVIEMPEVKKAVYNNIESVVGDDAIIASNTSAIPITELQQYLKRPARFLGIHWAEPSYMTRFMEITCGEKTTADHADWVFELAHHWGKEPTLLKKDLRGFVTNRLMYAIYREGLHLVDTGQATLEDVDKIFRYDAGSWMTLMGIFRRMDFMGLKDYPEILKNTFPKLSNDEKVPAVMEDMIDMKARGTQSIKGLFPYTKEEAKKWDDAFALFNEEIFRLAALYPSVKTGAEQEAPI
jgi:3-hydroxybutyryl-CoA dehydrogenase